MLGWGTGFGGYVIWLLSGVVPEDWRSAVMASLKKGKRGRTECKNYGGISLLNVVGKIYSGGVPEFNGTGIQKTHYYLEIYLTFCNFLTLCLL